MFVFIFLLQNETPLCCSVPIYNIFPSLLCIFMFSSAQGPLPNIFPLYVLAVCCCISRPNIFFRLLPFDIPFCCHSILPSFPLIQYVSFFSSPLLEYLHPLWLPDIWYLCHPIIFGGMLGGRWKTRKHTTPSRLSPPHSGVVRLHQLCFVDTAAGVN